MQRFPGVGVCWEDPKAVVYIKDEKQIISGHRHGVGDGKGTPG